MTVLNPFHKILSVLLLSMVCWTPAIMAKIQFFDLKNPGQPLDQPVIQQGGALMIKVPPGTTVWWNNSPVFIDAEGRGLIAVHRDADQSELRIVTPEGESSLQQLPIVRRDYRIERVNGLPPSKVSAPADPELQARIRQEVRAIRTARQRVDDRPDFLKGFIWPVEGRISGRYGSQRILNGEPKTPHYGVDVAVPTGTPVVAPADGIVIYANPDMYYSGGTLVIDHGHGLSSAFLHLSSILVPSGTRVKQGQVVAKVGATGRATGPHLDWRMNWGSKVRVDPQLVVQSMSK